MIYLRAEDNEAGVTVEESGPGSVHVDVRHTHAYYSDAEARAVVEGLLRRMLERDGIDRFNELCDGVVKAWWNGRLRAENQRLVEACTDLLTEMEHVNVPSLGVLEKLRTAIAGK